MRFRLGYVLGFSCGYYLGTRAGRERYDQLNRLLAKARRSDAYEIATEKAKHLVDDGVEKAKDVLDDGVERAREIVEERRSTGGGDSLGSDSPGPGPGPTVHDLSPGPPPAGSLSQDMRSGGPVAP